MKEGQIPWPFFNQRFFPPGKVFFLSDTNNTLRNTHRSHLFLFKGLQ